MHERIDAGAAGGGEWTDGDDPKVREAFGFQLRDHVSYQGGEHSLAPTLVFADCDYEVGDGSCGLYEDGKSANEPAIVYVRADAFIALRDAFARLCDDAEGWMQKDEWGTWPYMEGEGVYSDKSDFEISLRVAREMLARVGSERNKSET